MNELIPAGTDVIMRWAMGLGLACTARPEESWLRAWEPFDTMVAPARYVNAVSWQLPPGAITVVEPWTEEGLLEPMERTLLAFASHAQLRHRCAFRVGEHFITRVSSLTHTPPPVVTIGDTTWDEHVVTLAHSVADARTALTGALRALLGRWGFRGHVELRPGGAVIHYAGLQPIPQHYADLRAAAQQVVAAALTPG